MIVYKTTNLVNGKIYIGKDTKNEPTYIGSGMILAKAIQKYGKESFVKEILEECDDAIMLAEKEKFWISKFNCTDRKIGYNITDGGFGGDTFTNNPNKEHIRKKHKDATSKRNKRDGGWSPDTLKRVEMAKGANAARTANGYRHSEETKRKLSNTLTGRVITTEWRKNISIATKEAMAKIDQKELQQKALEGRKKAWAARDEKRKEELKEILKLGLKAPENIKMLGVSPPTYYKILNMIKK